MKRIIQISIIAIAVLISQQVMAQRAITININSGYKGSSPHTNRVEYKELKRFQNQVDRFNYAIDEERINQARKIKSNLIKKMRSEIRDTQRKLRKYKVYKNSGGLKQKYDVSYQYRKNRNTNWFEHRDYKMLELLHTKQRKLLFKFENLYLERSHRFYKQARKHQKLLYDFENTMWKSLSFDKHQNRNRYR